MIYCIIAKASLIARGSRLHQTMSFIIDQHAPRDTDSFGDLSHLKKFFLACFHFASLLVSTILPLENVKTLNM